MRAMLLELQAECSSPMSVPIGSVAGDEVERDLVLARDDPKLATGASARHAGHTHLNRDYIMSSRE
jgi:hypothetical protein